ncbi:MAG: DNA-binding protein [Bdellovibrionaceae bacterium]|nr:DNA-binding protein [Pseudobdellovibrionaceae bacterium]
MGSGGKKVGFIKTLSLIFILSILTACAAVTSKNDSHPAVGALVSNQSVHNTTYTFRLKPGDDIKKSLLQFAQEHSLYAASIISAVGSVTEISIRYANQTENTVLKGHFEIVSLTGTLSASACHLHVAVSDNKGKTVGGHLTEGSRIYTTLEMTLIEQHDLEYSRDTDPQTTFNELNVKIRK